jgi:transposase
VGHGQSPSLNRAAGAAAAGLHAKKKSLVAKEREAERIQRWRAYFFAQIARIAPARLVFVDETGTHTSMTREHGWGRGGKRVVGVVPRQRGTVLTVVGAVALDGPRAFMAYEGGTDKTAFLRFVHDALVPSLHRGDVVVLDNLGAHKAIGVAQAIRAVGADLLYLPPYHPELNPIELAWAKVKRLLRKMAARTLQTLAIAVRDAKDAIAPADVAGWFTHCGYAAQAK